MEDTKRPEDNFNRRKVETNLVQNKEGIIVLVTEHEESVEWKECLRIL